MMLLLIPWQPPLDHFSILQLTLKNDYCLYSARDWSVRLLGSNQLTFNIYTFSIVVKDVECNIMFVFSAKLFSEFECNITLYELRLRAAGGC
jgi:hypothetical protein